MNIDSRAAHRDARTAPNDRARKMLGLGLKIAGFGVGYCYPTYSALKLLDRKVIGPEDVTLWLTYFLIAFTLAIGEAIAVRARADASSARATRRRGKIIIAGSTARKISPGAPRRANGGTTDD